MSNVLHEAEITAPDGPLPAYKSPEDMPSLSTLQRDINTVFSLLPKLILIDVIALSEEADGLHLDARIATFSEGGVGDLFNTTWRVLSAERRHERWRLMSWAVALYRVVDERLNGLREGDPRVRAVALEVSMRLFEPNPLLRTLAYEEQTLYRILRTSDYFG